MRCKKKTGQSNVAQSDWHVGKEELETRKWGRDVAAQVVFELNSEGVSQVAEEGVCAKARR